MRTTNLFLCVEKGIYSALATLGCLRTAPAQLVVSFTSHPRGRRFEVGWRLMIGAGRLANEEVIRGLKDKSCRCQRKDPEASRRQIMANHWVLDLMKLSG
ncbi:hypothetical protein Tco_0543594 [Tanacetum coccineum]